MSHICCVTGCPNGNGQGNKEALFHKFPLHRPDLLDPWIKATKLGFNWTPTRSSRICGNHFLATDYIRRPSMTDRILKPNAVPSLVSVIKTEDCVKNEPTRVYPAKKLSNPIKSTSPIILRQALERPKATEAVPAKQAKTTESAKLDSVEVGQIIKIITPVFSAAGGQRAEVIALGEGPSGGQKPEVPSKKNINKLKLVTQQGKIIHEQLCRQVMEDEKIIRSTESALTKTKKTIKHYETKFDIFRNVYRQLGLESLPPLEIDSDDDIDKSDDDDDDETNAGEILIEEDIMSLDTDEPFNQVHFTFIGESDDPKLRELKKKYDSTVEEDLQLSRKLMVLRHRVFMKNKSIEELECSN